MIVSRSVVRRSACVVAVLFTVIAGTATPASAHFYGHGMSYPNYYYRVPTSNAGYVTAISNAAANWNGHALVNIRRNDSSACCYIYNAERRNETYLGHYSGGGGSFGIILNTWTIEKQSGNLVRIRQSVAAHEFGHSFSLAHNNLTSIMSHSRNRSTVYTRQAHDNSDVTSYYG